MGLWFEGKGVRGPYPRSGMSTPYLEVFDLQLVCAGRITRKLSEVVTVVVDNYPSVYSN